jgi:hypothetical protein
MMKIKKLSILLALFVGLVLPVNAAAQGPAQPEFSDPTWSAYYYDNMELVGDPVVIRTEEQINHNWRAGSPGPQVPANRFSARWLRSVTVSAGTYRFTVTSDDGVRVWVDDTLILDEWNDHAAQTFFVDHYLETGEHLITVEYYEHTGSAVMQLSWTLASQAGGRWRGKYYNNTALRGLPVLVRNDAAIDFDWDTSSPDPGLVNADFFSASWTRDINVAAGLYEFEVVTDDGARLWVNGELLIDAWFDQAATTYTANTFVPEGTMSVRLEYYEHTGYAVIQFDWSSAETVAPPVEADVVDDASNAFVQGGGRGEWLRAAGGVNDRFSWTYNNQAFRTGYNWGRWYPDVTLGDYEVYAYVPVHEDLTTHARYGVSHAEGFTWRVVDQVANQGRWVSLGIYQFRGDGSGYVTLSDVTFETPRTRTVAFDAVRWEPR